MGKVSRLSVLFSGLLRFVKEKKIWLIPLCALIGAVASLAVAVYVIPKEYVSTETVAVLNDVHGEEYEAEALSASHHLAELYAISAAHDKTAQATVRQCGLDITPSQLLSGISASRTEFTIVVRVTLRMRDAALLESTLAAYVDNLNAVLMPTLGIDNVFVLHAPTAPVEDRHIGISAAIGAAAGALAGILACIILLVKSNKIESQAQLEAMGLPVFGSIPSVLNEKDSAEGKKRDKKETRYERE